MKILNITIAILGICFFACKQDQDAPSPTPKMSTNFVKTHSIDTIQESDIIDVLGIVMSEAEAKKLTSKKVISSPKANYWQHWKCRKSMLRFNKQKKDFKKRSEIKTESEIYTKTVSLH